MKVLDLGHQGAMSHGAEFPGSVGVIGLDCHTAVAGGIQGGSKPPAKRIYFSGFPDPSLPPPDSSVSSFSTILPPC